MSASNFILSAKRKIRQGDVAFNRINSENVQTKIGGSINGLIDSLFYTIDYSIHGYIHFNNNFRQAPYRIHKTSDIIYYQFSIFELGFSGVTVVNAVVRDENGAIVGNLFGTGSNRLLISNGTSVDVQIGRDLTVPSNFSINASSVVFQYGVLNYTTLQAGWSLSPFIENSALNARGMRFVLRLREQ